MFPCTPSVTVTAQQGCRSRGLGVLTQWKHVRGVRLCFEFWPPKISHSFIQNCYWITANFTSSRIKDLCQKWKVKLIFYRGAWNSLMAWPDWPRPPIFYDRSTPLLAEAKKEERRSVCVWFMCVSAFLCICAAGPSAALNHIFAAKPSCGAVPPSTTAFCAPVRHFLVRALTTAFPTAAGSLRRTTPSGRTCNCYVSRRNSIFFVKQTTARCSLAATASSSYQWRT